MSITIKRKSAGQYYVKENPDIVIYNPKVAYGEDYEQWITSGMGHGDSSRTKKEAVEYAQWIYDNTK